MSISFLLDTNIVSEPLRRDPEPAILEKLRQHGAEIAIASIVWHELRFGVARLPPSRRRELIERYLAEVVLPTIPVLEYDQVAAEWHALERARLAARGVTPPFIDGQIAAIAAVNDLVLVTRNATDFKRFKDLRVRRWA